MIHVNDAKYDRPMYMYFIRIAASGRKNSLGFWCLFI
jgi:hypothetical protein